MCTLQNETTNPELCDVAEGQICSCASPDPFETTLTITGNFTTTTATNDVLQTALEEDLYAVFQQYVCVYTFSKNNTHVIVVLRLPKGLDTSKVAILLANTNWLSKFKTALGSGSTVTGVTASNLPWPTSTAPRPSSAAQTIGLGAVIAMAALSLLV
jgi:hypothetical protein